MYLEDMVSPRRHFEVEPLGGEVISISIVHGHTQLILKPPGPTGEVIPRQDYITLTWVTGVVHRHQAVEVSWSTPREDNKRLIAAISFPGATGIEELPISVTDCRIFQTIDDRIVERGDVHIRHLNRSPSEVDWEMNPLAITLPLVEETQPWNEEGDYSSSPVDLRFKCRRGAWLVVVL